MSNLPDRIVKALLLTLALGGCSMFANKYYNDHYGTQQPRDRIVSAGSINGDFYHHQVKPIIESRCVVCHGCYDAPCQLKLSSPEGIDRGLSKVVVYNTGRLLAAKPSRLFEDAYSTPLWRERKFFPALNERDQRPVVNLDAGLLYQSLKLKKQNPLSQDAILNSDFDLSLNRQQQCPTISEWAKFSRSHPDWGMPYALPGLTNQEFNTLTQWLKTGALMANKPDLEQPFQNEINKWERFLNGDTLKQRLMGRYIYEHWYLAHLYFQNLAGDELFRLVRSRTPPGEIIDRIATRRPYDDPEIDRVYYRFWREKETVIAKTHIPYALDDKRLNWINKLFLQADYEITSLPAYTPEIAGNPFIAFQEIPLSNRWRFILEEAQFTIMNFIKGPVCRGQVALNVINDHFWVVFVNPDIAEKYDDDDFLPENMINLRMPNEEQSNVRPIKTWLSYSKSQLKYLEGKTKWLNQNADKSLLNLDLIWDGGGLNSNVALTIFRHFDSASVVKGLVGNAPKTAWLINYTLLERIHYLLVAGYDVYGNLGHQLTTRLYMDFLRMEGEFNFLALLPVQVRKQTRNEWYKDADKNVKKFIFGEYTNFQRQTGIEYNSDDVKTELYGKIKQRLDAVLNRKYELDHPSIPAIQVNYLKRLNQGKGFFVSLLPQTIFLTVTSSKTAESNYYTIIHNNSHSSITSLFNEKKTRLVNEDYITVVRGFIGDYPSAFWQVDENNLSQLVDDVFTLKDGKDYAKLMNSYGIRRTDNRFWQKSDELYQAYKEFDPVYAGLFDFNRLENR